MKRTTVGVVVMTLAILLAGCAADPPGDTGQGVLRCGPAAIQVNPSPAISLNPAPTTLSLGDLSEASGCQDTTGHGVTSVRMESLDVSFPSLSCYSGPGLVGSGTASLRYSDGSISTATLTAMFDSPLTGMFVLYINDGPFAGFHGLADFFSSPAAGDCTAGVTSQNVWITGITMAPDQPQ